MIPNRSFEMISETIEKVESNRRAVLLYGVALGNYREDAII